MERATGDLAPAGNQQHPAAEEASLEQGIVVSVKEAFAFVR